MPSLIDCAPLALCLFAYPCAAAPQLTQETDGIDAKLLNTVVPIVKLTDEHAAPGKAESQAFGSGFLVRSPGNHVMLITARHLIVDPSGGKIPNLAYGFKTKNTNFVVTTETEQAQMAGEWFFSAADDLACRFIIVNDFDIQTFAMDEFLPLNAVRPGAPIWILGFPLTYGRQSYTAFVRQGIIAAIDGDEILVDATIVPGNSGGPVLYLLAARAESEPAPRAEKHTNSAVLIGAIQARHVLPEGAVSQQTGRLRITFEENTGLSSVISADTIRKLIQRDDVREYERMRWP